MGPTLRGGTADNLTELYAPIRDELSRVDALLRSQLSSSYPFVDELAKHSFRLGGKRMRPALVLLSARASGTLVDAHYTIAATVELIHTATLVHDDVLDEADLRRHVATVNSAHDNETSVLLGDLLFAQSLCLMGELDDNRATKALGRAARQMCEGELRQIASRGNFDLNEDDYFGIIAAKTAALTAVCTQLGGLYAGANEQQCAALEAFGRELGVAFQVADDLLDLLGDEHTAGKSLGTDLVKQKLTLPLIRLLATALDVDRRAVVDAISGNGGNHREALRSWLDRSDAVAYAQQRAESHVRRAISLLAQLPPSAARRSLEGLAEFALWRRT